MSMKLFHYTRVYSAVMILRDGVIRRSSGKTPPYVWLSSNPIDEPTAARPLRLDGTDPPMANGSRAFGGGAFRVP